jgi:hypothetical protein
MSLSGATKGRQRRQDWEPGEQWLVSRSWRLRLAETGKGALILPDHEPVVKTASTGGGLLHSKTPTMSRLGTIDWPSFEDYTGHARDRLVGLLTDIRTSRLHKAGPRLSNVQTFYGRQTLH